MDKHHLVAEINSYDSYMKELDKSYLNADNSILKGISAKSKYESEHHSEMEMETIFKQQIRKIMSKQVKLHEGHVKSNV